MTGPATGTSRGPGPPLVLVATPRPPDRAVLFEALVEAGIPAEPVRQTTDLARRLPAVGCLVVTREALTDDLIGQVSEALGTQPAWSELPILLLTDADTAREKISTALAENWKGARIVELTRPLGPMALVASIRLAVSARSRQYEIRDQLREEEALRLELSHRVKNLLATVQAMASMTRRLSASPERAFEQFSDRLGALAAVHASLDNRMAEGVRFGEVADRVLQPYRASAGERIAVTGTARGLDAQAANALGLCLNELATNAVKYGALSVPDGRIRVSLLEEETGARFDWREEGGPASAPPERTGFGTRFVTVSLTTLFDAEPRRVFGEAGFALSVAGPARRLFRNPGEDA